MTKSIRIAILMALCLVLVTPAAATAASASAKYESQVFKYTNAERTHRDLKKLKKLKASVCIDRFAESQATKMRKAQKLSHQSLAPIMKKCGLKSAGENVAYGYSNGKQVTAAWMKSKGHKANILKKGYRLIGNGAVKDSRGRWWVSQVFGTVK